MSFAQRFSICLTAMVILAGCATTEPTPIPSLPPPTSVEREGQLIKGDTARVYQARTEDSMQHIVDWATFLAYRFSPGDVVTVPPEELNSYQLMMPLTRLVTGETDTRLYLVYNGRRYPVTDESIVRLIDVYPTGVTPLPDAILETLPLAMGELPIPATFADEPIRIRSAAWFDGALWIASGDGQFERWTPEGSETPLPNNTAIHKLYADPDALYAAEDDGSLWRVDENGGAEELLDDAGWITALTADSGGDLWYAAGNNYALDEGRYQIGRGVVQRSSDGSEQVLTLDDTRDDPLKNVTALALDEPNEVLWIGTQFAGLVRYHLADKTWTQYTTLNSAIPDNLIRDVVATPEGLVWFAVPGGIARFDGTIYQFYAAGQNVSSSGIADVTLAPDGDVWFAGENVVGKLAAESGELTTHTPIDDPIYLDHFSVVVLDNDGLVWAVGSERTIQFGEGTPTVYERSAGVVHEAPPIEFPSPASDYDEWLAAWSRPADDNGLCMHYRVGPTGDEYEARQQITRLQGLHVRWVLVNYSGQAQLLQLAPLFQRAGMMVVWRPFVRPYEDYDWSADVRLLRSLNIPPYVQVYNEPSLGQEWETRGDGQPDQAVYLEHLIPAVRAVYDAGGYVGIQQIDQAWLRASLRRMQAEGLGDTFDRLFFVPHPYGFNHPPEYTQDEFGVLGFREYARVFEEEIGFVPPMIAGEGGWRPGEAQDDRYPLISEELHRDYHLAVFDWFRSGRLSNGEPLPDYLFAYCPWLIADPYDPAAWYDSASGDRRLTIEAVEALPLFIRDRTGS